MFYTITLFTSRFWFQRCPNRLCSTNTEVCEKLWTLDGWMHSNHQSRGEILEQTRSAQYVTPFLCHKSHATEKFQFLLTRECAKFVDSSTCKARRRPKDSWLERLQDCKKVRIEARTPEARNSLQWRNESTMFIDIFSVFNREKL